MELESSKDILEIAKKEAEKKGTKLTLWSETTMLPTTMPCNMTKRMLILPYINPSWKCLTKRKS